jgi:hypothetical protein
LATFPTKFPKDVAKGGVPLKKFWWKKLGGQSRGLTRYSPLIFRVYGATYFYTNLDH